MSKIVKLSDEFYFDLDDFSAIFGNDLYLKSKKEAISVYAKQRTELRKILDKEIEVRKAEERVSPFRLDPIGFMPCKDCGKQIPISAADIKWQKDLRPQCNPCHEKELEENLEGKQKLDPFPTETKLRLRCDWCDKEGSDNYFITEEKGTTCKECCPEVFKKKETKDGCVNCGHSPISYYEKNLCLQCFWALEEEKEEEKNEEVEASGLEDFISKKCITCEKQFWVGAAVNDECLRCQLSEDK